MRLAVTLAPALILAFAGVASAETHLFILSGQSNMAGLKPEISFTPTVTKALAGHEVIVVKNAKGGQPIRRWYKDWKASSGDGPKADGQLYDALLADVRKAVGEKQPDTVTFVWMQGERDAKSNHGDVYAKSLRGLIDQLQADLGRKDVNFVIGRLSDHLSEEKSPHWALVRKAQVDVAEADPRGEWVDTDDLNGRNDGLHYDREGYAELGRRFAEKALKLVNGE